MKKSIILLLFTLLSHLSHASVWHVGPLQTYTAPSQVATLVSNGDTVEIEAGIYNSDVARWSADNLLIKGVGGMAHLKANGNSYGGKAIWVIAGNNTRIENIEFSLCSVPDNNGAGIRQEGHNLWISHCYFHDNEDGILAGTVNPSNITIEYSEFNHNGFGDGQSHNLYINNIDTLIFRYNYSHLTPVGHEFKSRAHVNFILYNRISDESSGTASRSIDLPNGGTVYMIGNVIEQGPLSENHNIIGYGLEGLSNPTPHEVYAVNNTIVNNYSGGSFFQFNAQTAVFKAYNNILAGQGSFVSGAWPTQVDTAGNLRSTDISTLAFADTPAYDYHLTVVSTAAINAGTNPGSANNVSLSPVFEYLHPSDATPRCNSGLLDIGAFEYCAIVEVVETIRDQPSVYPNPSTGIVNIQMPDSECYSVEIRSLTGQLLRKMDNAKTLDITSFPRGIYLLWIRQGTQIRAQKIIKE